MKKTARKNLEVTKSNALIRASYRLGAVEQQMVMFSIAQARETQQGLRPDSQVVIRATDFAKAFGISTGNVYAMLKDGLDALFHRWVSFHHTDIESGAACHTKSHWISDASYIEGHGEVRLTFAPLIIPHLMRLEPGFTRYTLADIGALSGAHAIRLYELLVRFKATGWAKISKTDLRFAFGLEPHEYKLTNDFHRKVLRPALAQIQEKTSLRVHVEDIRRGKSIVAWEFKFYEKVAPEPEPEVEPFDDAWIAARARPGESTLDARARLYPIYKRDVLKIIDDEQAELLI